MNILAIDTSASNLTIALSRKGKIIRESNIVLNKLLSSEIIPNVDKALRFSKLDLKKIDCIAFGLGPGSFTSLRVGLSTIKGFCFVNKMPVIGISSLDAIALNVKEENVPVAVILDARRNKVYACLYKIKEGQLKRTSKYLLTDIDSVLNQIKGKAVFVGDGLTLYYDKIINSNKCLKVYDKKSWLPNAKNLIALAVSRIKEKKYDDINKLQPLYLYAHDCQVHK